MEEYDYVGISLKKLINTYYFSIQKHFGWKQTRNNKKIVFFVKCTYLEVTLTGGALVMWDIRKFMARSSQFMRSSTIVLHMSIIYINVAHRYIVPIFKSNGCL